jgi:hypothetical protein
MTDAEVEAAINKARERILALKENWDGEGAERVKPELFDKAAQILRNLFHIAREHGQLLSFPEISPYGDGSVDVWWTEGESSLLVNTSEVKEEPLTFAFNNGGKDVTSGKVMAEMAGEVLFPLIRAANGYKRSN